MDNEKYNLGDLTTDNLFNFVELGFDEPLIIDAIGYLNPYPYFVLVKGDGVSINVRFNALCCSGVDDFIVNDIVRCAGILKLDTEDLFCLDLREIWKVSHLSREEDNIGVDDIIGDGVVDRNDPQVRDFIRLVLERDKVCQCCGADKHLEVHHINSWYEYPALRVDVNNGVALCKWCHHKYNSIYGHKGNAVNFGRFMRQFGVR